MGCSTRLRRMGFTTLLMYCVSLINSDFKKADAFTEEKGLKEWRGVGGVYTTEPSHLAGQVSNMGGF